MIDQEAKKSNFLPVGPYGLITAAIIVAAVALGLFAVRLFPEKGVHQMVAARGVSNAFQIDVINVDPVIAQHFRLKELSGALINDIPSGTARRVIRLKRGDVILRFNDVQVQSTEHLAHLMSHVRAGEVVRFLVSRDGQHVDVSARIPKPAGITDLIAPTTVNISVVLLILVLTFVTLFLNLMERTVCLVLGAVLMLVAGSLLGFYDQVKAYRAIHMSPILILVGMSVFSIFLERLKFFDYAAKKIVILMEGHSIRVAIALCALTYGVSLFINNLTTIMVIVPITLYTCRQLKMPPIPVVIGEIIASNVGGASTMIGDFPNILISSNTGLSFMDFLLFMTPVCLVIFVATMWYMKFAEFSKMKIMAISPAVRTVFLQKMAVEMATMPMDWPSIKRVLGMLGGVVVGLILFPAFGVGAATITLGGSFILLAMEHRQAREVIKKISFSDILFFIALFIVVGGALNSGILMGISNWLDTVSGNSQFAYCILLMWGVAFITAFLNAGPTTAFFLPVVLNSPFAGLGDLVWWSLSLGILAGSSATLTGATAGIVTQTLLEDDREAQGKVLHQPVLTFGEYSKCGIPVALIILAISSAYIAFLESLLGVVSAGTGTH